MTAPSARPTLTRWQLRLLLAPIIALSVVGILGDWFGAAIINEHPLVQMFINPRIRWMAGAANEIDPIPFYVVGFFRLVLTDPLFYILGYCYGDAAVKWIEKKMGDDSGFIQKLVDIFGRASYVIVAVAPSGNICALAGASGMNPVAFAILNIGGTIARLVLIRRFAAVFDTEIKSVLGFVQDYQWWIVGVSVGLGLIQLASRKKKGRSEIESIDSIERSLLEAEAEVEAEEAARLVREAESAQSNTAVGDDER